MKPHQPRKAEKQGGLHKDKLTANKMTKGGVSYGVRRAQNCRRVYDRQHEVRIATDYCCRAEEVPKILERIARNALDSLRAKASIACNGESKG